MNGGTQTTTRARCDACENYAKMGEMEGQCRLNPPHPHPHGGKGLFPIVAANQWCRQHLAGTPSTWTKATPETPGQAAKQAFQLKHQPKKNK